MSDLAEVYSGYAAFVQFFSLCVMDGNRYLNWEPFRSALAANMIIRSVLACSFPLIGRQSAFHFISLPSLRSNSKLLLGNSDRVSGSSTLKYDFRNYIGNVYTIAIHCIQVGLFFLRSCNCCIFFTHSRSF